jgi:hypothetical protein
MDNSFDVMHSSHEGWNARSLRLLISLLLIFAAFALFPVAYGQLTDRAIRSDERDGPNADHVLGLRLYTALQYDNPEFLAKLFLEAHEQPTLADGKSTVVAIYTGYKNILVQEKQWEPQLEKIRKWQASEPQNVNAVLTEAAYWIAYGRFARGAQFATNVPPKAFELMHERMVRAKAVLEAIRPAAATNQVWYVQMLNIALIDGWSAARRATLFSDAIRADPYFYSTYGQMAASLTPRWGGSLNEYHHFVESAVARTQSREGNSYYARLSWNLAEIESNQDPFRDLRISWRKMNAGFDDLMRRYPDSQWNLHHYAYFACRAGDGKTFNKLRPTLDLQKMNRMPTIWGQAYTLEFCTDQFTQRI